MSSPYKRFSGHQEEKSSCRRMTSLTPGRRYEIFKFETAKNDFAPDSTNLIAFIFDGKLRFRMILPSDYANPPKEDVEAMNKDIANKKPPSLCFYGVSGAKYVSEIIEFGGDIDQDKLAAVTAIVSAESPKKRPAETEQSTPSKKEKRDDK